jgi:type I restriction enzyme M protein
LWIYDARANVPGITKKDRPLSPSHFAKFEECYGSDPFGRAIRSQDASPEDRWRAFGVDDVRERRYNLDGLRWLRDEESENAGEASEPDVLLAEALDDLQGAMAELEALQMLLESLAVEA